MTNSEYESTTLAEMQKRAWVTTDRVRSHHVTIPKGSAVRIIGKRGGLTIQTRACPRCGVEATITRVSPYKVEEVL
jgi:hypothetical protein